MLPALIVSVVRLLDVANEYVQPDAPAFQPSNRYWPALRVPELATARESTATFR